MVSINDDEKNKALIIIEYQNLCHAMQTGVGMEQRLGSSDGSPKHFRVGINAAMINHAAMVKLLITKGVISELEYFTALRDGMKEEVKKYEAVLGVKLT